MKLEVPSDEDFDSDLSSPGSTPPRPSSPYAHRYPSPPSSRQSASRSPPPESSAASSRDECPPPAKRRKMGPKVPRQTRHLNLHDPTEAERESQAHQLEQLLKALRQKRKIVIVAGAGISVSAGIPDFRSSTGLFKSLKSQHKLKGSGKHLFDASVYRDEAATTSFHQMVRSLSSMTKSAKPTAFHHLVARLAQEGRLLRLYSQNVDGIDTSLEPLATEIPLPRKGPWPKTIQVHGGLDKMMCVKCHALSDFDSQLFNGPVPPQCKACLETDQVRTEVAGKRSHGIGMLRPRMVLYNEHNPDDEAIGSVTKSDLRTRPDAVIVAGTSLKVPGVRRIVKEMCGVVRDRRDGFCVWINNDPVPAGKLFEDAWDLVVKGTSDDVADLASLGRWDEYDASIGAFEEVTQETVDKVKERSEPQVVVDSPPKKTPFKAIDGMPTPIASPRPLPLPVDDFDLTIQTKTAHVALPTVANPASRGRSLHDVLKTGSAKSAKGAASAKPKAAKQAPAAAKRSTKAAAPKKKPSTGANQSIKLNFTTTKPTGNKNAASSKPEKSDEPSKAGTDQPKSPRNSQASQTLHPLSPNPVRFPNLMAKAAAQIAGAR